MKQGILIAVCLVAQAVWAEPFTVGGIKKSAAHACSEGEAVEVSGITNVVTLTGSCGAVKVTGQGHVVTLETVASIEVSGQKNQVTWQQAAVGKKPKVAVSGQNNVVKHAEAAN